MLAGRRRGALHVDVGVGLSVFLRAPERMGDELRDREVVLPEQPGGHFGAVVSCNPVMLRALVLNDLHGDSRHVAAVGGAAVGSVPADLSGSDGVCRSEACACLEVLPGAGVVDVEMHSGRPHVLVGVGGPGVLLAVVVDVRQVAGVVDGHGLHLAGAAGELLVLLVQTARREVGSFRLCVVLPAVTVRDDELPDLDAVHGVGCVRCEHRVPPFTRRYRRRRSAGPAPLSLQLDPRAPTRAHGSGLWWS